MRWIVSFFSLGGLLIGVGVVVYVEGLYSTKVIKQSEPVRDEAQQISGHDTDGTPVAETFTVQGEIANGKLKDLLVTSIVPGSAMERYYGLKQGDQVTQVGPLGVSDLNDAEMATANLQEAYQRKQPLGILRNGVAMTLNGGDSSPADVGAPSPTGAPSAPAAAPPSNPGGTQLPGGIQLPPGVQVPGQQ